jgi:hypothetical protein
MRNIYIISILIIASSCTTHQEAVEAYEDGQIVLKAHEESAKRIMEKRGNQKILYINVPQAPRVISDDN